MTGLNYLCQDTYSVFWREMRLFFQQKSRVVTAILQPIVWLVLLGSMLDGLMANPFAIQFLGFLSYLDFITPGIAMMAAVFGGVFAGASVVSDRRTGFLAKMLIAPLAREAIPWGKVLAAVVQSLIQVVLVLLLGSLMGVDYATGPWGVAFLIVLAASVCVIATTLSLLVATFVRSQEALSTVMSFLTIPLMFTSNALFPKEAMPEWLATVSQWNPLSYAVTTMRSLVMGGFEAGSFLQGSIIIFVCALVLLVLSGRRFATL